MSRQHIDIDENITVCYGTDQAIGQFLYITDRRFAGSPDDMQGEGYVFEWSEAFGISTNLIGATDDDILDRKTLIAKTRDFISTLNITR